MKFAQRVQKIGESATLKVARRARELKEAGVDIVDLSVGEPDFPSPQCAVDAAKAALDRGFTRYTANNGITPLRQALADSYRQRHGSPWTAAQVEVTVGAKMALYELAQVLVDEGDQVILPAPYWVSLPEQVRLAGGEPVFVPTRAVSMCAAVL
jgi:aspartate aminotransferase